MEIYGLDGVPEEPEADLPTKPSLSNARYNAQPYPDPYYGAQAAYPAYPYPNAQGHVPYHYMNYMPPPLPIPAPDTYYAPQYTQPTNVIDSTAEIPLHSTTQNALPPKETEQASLSTLYSSSESSTIASGAVVSAPNTYSATRTETTTTAVPNQDYSQEWRSTNNAPATSSQRPTVLIYTDTEFSMVGTLFFTKVLY